MLNNTFFGVHFSEYVGPIPVYYSSLKSRLYMRYDWQVT